jgi:hypothetical protein
MFCNNCGKKIEKNQKYCNGCGVSIEGGASFDGTTAQSSPTDGLQPAQMKRKKQTQALAAVLAALTVITMLLEWSSFRFSITQDAVKEIRTYSSYAGISQSSVNILTGEKTLKATVSAVDRSFKGIYTLAKALEGELNKLPIGNISEAVGVIRAASVLLSTIKIVMTVAVCAMLIFIYAEIAGIKTGALIGQIGGALALLTAVVFAISMSVADSSVSRLLINLGAFNYFWLKISASVWVYVTMVLGFLDVVFIALRKKILKSE